MDPGDLTRILRDAVAAEPGNADLHVLLGEALVDGRRFEEAEGCFLAALRIESRNERGRLGLARAFLETGRLAECDVLLESFDEAAVSAGVLVMRSRLLAARGRLRAAARVYQQAVDVDQHVADPALAELLEPHRPAEDLDSEPESDPAAGDATREPALALESSDPIAAIERPETGFDSVGGMEAVKHAIRVRIIAPFEQPELYAAYGSKAGGGILLYGPPGCGKTHIARATAGEINATFLSVGLNDVLDMWFGNSEKRLHAIFEQARRARPCVLFFDEVDALGGARRNAPAGAGRTVVNQFLAELDGVAGDNEGVLILAATNTPWHVDDAFRRPGRFDRVLFVPPPDEPGRAEILRIHMESKPAADIDYKRLAKRTQEFSGADLRAVVDLAAQAELDKAIRTGQPEPITEEGLAAAVKGSRPTTREWFATAKNYVVHANHAGAYDEVAAYLGLK